jgi:hypothetical protein
VGEEEADDVEEGSLGGVGSFSADDEPGPGVEGRLTEGMKFKGSQVQAEGCGS